MAVTTVSFKTPRYKTLFHFNVMIFLKMEDNATSVMNSLKYFPGTKNNEMLECIK